MKLTFFALLALIAQAVRAQPESLTALEKTALGYANSERLKRGLAALGWDDRLARAARQHSGEMRDLGYISHTSPRKEFRTAPLRLAGAGISDAESAENLGHFASNDPADTLPVFVRRIHAGLMKSPGHRANILSPVLNAAGIGIAVGTTPDAKDPKTPLQAMWMTQNFVSRRIDLESVEVEKTAGGPLLKIKGSIRSNAKLFLVVRASGKENFTEVRSVSRRFSALSPLPADAREVTVEICLRRKGNVCAVSNVLVVEPSLPEKDAVKSGLGRE